MTTGPLEGPGLQVTDENGEWRASQQVRLHDGTAERLVVKAWVWDPEADGGNGDWRTHVDSVAKPELTVSAENYQTVVVTWNAMNATSVSLRHNGAEVHTTNQQAGTWRTTQHATPNTTATWTAVGTYSGVEISSDPVEVTPPPLDVPQNFRVTAVTTTSITYAWTPLSPAMRPDQAGYRFWNDVTAQSYFVPGKSTSSWRLTGLQRNTPYRFNMQAEWYQGAPPNLRSGTTANITQSTNNAYPTGIYYFAPTRAATYYNGSWRTDNAAQGKIWTGRYAADGWDSGRRITYFFDYRDAQGRTPWQAIGQYAAAGQVAKVTGAQVRAERIATSHGYWVPQNCWWNIHTLPWDGSGKPGAPHVSRAYHQSGALDLGDWDWFNFPLEWGEAFVGRHDGLVGLTWGRLDEDSGYMVGPYRMSQTGHNGSPGQIVIGINQ